MKTINEISLYDLMAEDIDVYINRNDTFGFDMFALDEEGETMFLEKGIHPYAADSFATFCEKYLTAYEKAKGLR